MAFMVPVAERFAAYHVETSYGTELVPVSVCGELDESEATFVNGWRGQAKVIRDTPSNVAMLRDYIEGTKVYGIERCEGWYARLSAPGYLDCTDWDGPHETAEQAIESVKDFYDVDDNGDDNDDPKG